MAPSKRFNGGIFGNTVGSDTDANNTSGVFSISQQYYMKQEGGWEPPLPGTQEGPAQYAAEVAARVDSPSSGYYYMQHPNARTGATGVYVNYCLFGDTNKHHGQAWNLAMHIRNDQTNWKTYTGGPSTASNQSAYSWDKWTVDAPESFTTNQSGGGGSSNQRTLILPSTNDYSGDVVTFGGTPSSGSFTEGGLYYYDGTNWELAYATQQQSSTGLLGICVDATTPELLVRGLVTNSQFGTTFTSGNRLYVSSLQGGTGKMMDSVPSSPASNSVLRAVGFVVNGTNSQVMFDPSQDFITFP